MSSLDRGRRLALFTLFAAAAIAGVPASAEASCDYYCDSECTFYATYYGWDPSMCCGYYESGTWNACTPAYCGDGACNGGESQQSCTSDCGSTNRIVYIHGRDFNTWPVEGFITNNPAWTHVRLDYNGSGRLHDSYTRNLIRDALINNCGTHTPNQCIIITASAGAPRTLLAMHDVAALGYSLRVPWQGHYASAEGGTEIADKWTRGWRRFVSRLLGKRRNGDDDLRVGRLRNDYWYIHYTPYQPVYMQAGDRNQSLFEWDPGWSPLSFKISGNGYMPCGMGDGMVPVHSAGGYANPWCNYSMCDAAEKYPWRTAHTCSLLPQSHMGTIVDSLRYGAAPMLAYTKTFGACSPDPEDHPGVPEAVTTNDSADLAGVPQENACNRFYCLTAGEAVCDDSEPPDRTVTQCLDFTCYFDGIPPQGPVCGDYVCEGDEWSSCPWDCYWTPGYPYY
jgi:hypothetical protein